MSKNIHTDLTNFVDVLIVGAGLSGIDMAYHLQRYCPNKRYVILEGRKNLGGTWDLFTYPGVRSDSDMQTFSYGFKPWKAQQAIASAGDILEYLQETVAENDIEKHIRFEHMVQAAYWQSDVQAWRIEATYKGEPVVWHCSFFMVCAGYYDYEAGYTPDFKGLADFTGHFIHPQHWDHSVDYAGKRIIVIGSGATAITLVPALAEKAAEVVMLQRSPSYILSRPLVDDFSTKAHSLLPATWAHFLGRWKNTLQNMYLYRMAKRKPNAVKHYLSGRIKKVLGDDYDVATHFGPSYNPWDQRLCAVPDNDLFLSIKAGKTKVLTAHIEHFTENGIRLKTGEELEADIIVSATGLQLKMLGGIQFYIDGVATTPGEHLNYKGLMLNDVPNTASVIGYTNASWTLKADLVCRYITRLLNYMDKHNKKVCVPRLQAGDDATTEPIIDFSSGYILRDLENLPKQGAAVPWKLHQNYISDMLMLKYGRINDGYLEFKP